MTDTIYAWSQTAASNANSDSTINWAEYQNPSTANDSARAMMARLAELLADLAPTRSSTGSANAYAVTTAAAGSALRNGEQITFIPNHSSTAACTLNVDGRGTKPWRPKAGTEFVADNILSGVPVTAYYSLSDDAWYSAAGYYVSALASGVALQSITARLPQIGDMVLSMDSSPGAGRIRLTEATQTVLKTAYPELNAWLSARSYPWGSTSTTFSLPPAAGYFLRFAATTSTIDPDGPRAAGATQQDGIKSHDHPVSVVGTTSQDPGHPHAYSKPNTAVGYTAGGSGSVLANSFATEATTTAGAHLHSVTASGTATTQSGALTETRPKNVAFHIDIVASTALAAAQIAVFGFPLQWDTGTTAANPGAGRVRGNNATLASITALYISTSDGWGVNITDVLTALSTGNVLHLSKVGAQANRITATVSGTPTAATGYVSVPVTVDLAAGTLADSDQLALEYSKGATGPTGPAGPSSGLPYDWNIATAGDPGSGKVLANHATLASATEINISKTGPSAQAFGPILALWDDSTSTIKGRLSIYTLADRTEWIEGDVTAITDNSTYYTVAISNVAGAGTPSADDDMVVLFIPKGDKGDTGATGATGPTGATGSTGATGPAWDQWQGAWQTATAYVVNDAVENDGSSYICTSGHTSGAGTEPGVGGSWATVWDLIAAKGADGIGTGDVTAASAFATDNVVVRSDGTGKGVQASGISIDDSNNVSGVAALSATTIELGHASDTTISRVSAGNIAVEGNAIYRAGGTDVPVADGGTGVSSLTAYAVMCGGTTSTGSVQSIASVGTAGQVLTSNGAGALPTFQAASAGTMVAQGRLTLTTGVPVLSSNVTAAGTVYFTPYNGNSISLYNGSAWTTITFSETSLALSGGTASRVHDVFGYNNSGSLALELLAWTNSTTRATAVTLQDGRLVKSGDATRLLLGSIYLDGSKQAAMQFDVGSANPSGQFGLCNVYNQVPHTARLRETTASWSYNSTTWRRFNSSGNSFAYVDSVGNVAVTGDIVAPWFPSGTESSGIHIGLHRDWSSGAPTVSGVGFENGSSTVAASIVGTLSEAGSVGRHTIDALERAYDSTTASIYATGWEGGQQVHMMTVRLAI